ncbi:MAG: GAP family protein [Actinobacteria bacterium]|nr:GAP family protein [Actinomycetota bacterium]
MLALALLVLSIGIADSVNPSTVAPALYLALGRDAVRSVVAFTAGVFVVYFAGGVVLTLGPGSAIPQPGAHLKHLIELALGGLTFVFACAVLLTRSRIAARLGQEVERVDRSSFLLGATIMVFELPTALPYFAAIAAIVASGRGALTQVLLLALFNVAFVVPLVGIALLRARAGVRGRARLEALRASLVRRAPVVLPALLFLISAALFAVGGIGLANG